MTPCPLCGHTLFHKSPPLLHLPPLRVYCDGCKGWLRWQATSETRRVQVAPLCPKCSKPMELKGCKDGVLRWGCETWQTCKSGMRPESATVGLDVPVYELVAWLGAEATDDEKYFSEQWERAQRRYEEIEAREKRFTKGWRGSATKLSLDFE